MREKAIEDIVRKTCEQVVLVKLFPRSAIQVVVQLMHEAGGLLSSIINGACMALVHAGKSLPVGSCLSNMSMFHSHHGMGTWVERKPLP